MRSPSARELSPAQLRLCCDPAALGFASTAELQHLPLPWIGQGRAEQAARFGMEMVQPDYNLFVLGEVGSGRTTLLTQMMHAQALQRPVPPDLCYLHNFDEAEHPVALRLPAGQGRQLRVLMVQLAKRLQAEIPKRLAQDDYKAESLCIEEASALEKDRGYVALSAYAETHHFGLMRDEGRMVFSLKDDKGQPVTAGKALALSPALRVAMDKAEAALRGEISAYLEKSQSIDRVMNEGLAALRRQTVKPLLEHELGLVLHGVLQEASGGHKLQRYVAQVQHAVLDNLELFQPGEDEELRLDSLRVVLQHLRVNVVVDHHGQVGAPVILEDNPSFRNLLGSIEYESDGHELVTDFSHIRAGSLLRAHGGFLLLHLRDLLSDEPMWEKLRRFMRNGRLQIEEPGMMIAPVAAVSLEPEAVDLQVKIVLIASVEEYYAVQAADPEFARRFRCKVDFVESFVASAESAHATAIFVAHTCERLGLLHCAAEAVAALIEETHRQAQDQARQSARFALCEALVVESCDVAKRRAASLVYAADVQAALLARMHRCNYPEQRLQESMADGERLMVVQGARVAQLNALTVVDLGDYRFGVPVRVSARSCAGEDGLLNIEREVEMSGPIHDKGVLILHSHLSALFGRIAPLALNAAVVFEQEYGGVEGDSASCAEFYALFSSLADVPIRQGIAVTGAMNQHGEILPVGGINEKIEGYFRCCQLLGLDGQQGVLMPERNLRHLMLDAAVVQAVAQGRFHIHTANTVAEGMALLTGLPFGEESAAGHGADTVLGRAEKKLLAFRRACMAQHAHVLAPVARPRRRARLVRL